MSSEHDPPRGFNFSPWTELPVAAPPAASAGGPAQTPGVAPWERVVAVLLLVGLAPVMLLVALAIKIESPGGPVIYRQQRVGVDRRRSPLSASHGAGEERRKRIGYGKLFDVLKFRTMIPNAERATGPVWATERDPRVTRVGRVLRKLRLDEIPQLFNVLRGEMRLIGPRPERPHFVERLSADIREYPRRQRIPPGITGLAQVERSYDATVDDVRKKVKYDIFYVENRCNMLNVKIFIKTILVAVLGRGAR